MSAMIYLQQINHLKVLENTTLYKIVQEINVIKGILQ